MIFLFFPYRSHSVWKQPEVLDWLMSNAKVVVDRFADYKKDVETGEIRYVFVNVNCTFLCFTSYGIVKNKL